MLTSRSFFHSYLHDPVVFVYGAVKTMKRDRLWVVIFVVCAVAASRGQQRKATYIRTVSHFISDCACCLHNYTAFILNHPTTYIYDETVTLRCVTFGSSPPHNFTWVVPPDSTSL